MPFGIKKSDADADLDSKKSSLFGKKSGKPASPAPGNPYAVPPSNNNPYATQAGAQDPYAPRSQSSFNTQPPTSSFGNLTLKSESSGPPSYRSPSPQPNQYGRSSAPTADRNPSAARYQSSGTYGQTGGYGHSPYGDGSQSRHGPGGYGGLGRTTSQDTVSTDVGRNALFGDAANRVAQAKAGAPSEAEDRPYNNSGGYGAAGTSNGYGESPARELTAEEEEEEAVGATKQQIRDLKREDLSRMRNVVRMGAQANSTADGTANMLREQGERIHNTERNLDSASNQNRLAEEKARELKTLNRSMFAVHVANPFTAKKREEAANALALEKNQREREQRDTTAAEAYSTRARNERQDREANGIPGRTTKAPKDLNARAKFQFEADSEDEGMEDEMDDLMDAAYQEVRALNRKGKNMGENIASDNKHLDRVTKKTDKVDDQIAVNRARLDRIK